MITKVGMDMTADPQSFRHKSLAVKNGVYY
jgi:hypothetical protein